MTDDAKLIFEAYKQKLSHLNEEERRGPFSYLPDPIYNTLDLTKYGRTGELLSGAAHIVDPTGTLSYDEFLVANDKFNKEGGIINGAVLVLTLINALPNFGLLAAGVGGIGWAAVKGAARSAVKEAATNPQNVVTLTNQLLTRLSKMPMVIPAMERVLNALVDSKKISQNLADDIIAAVRKGSISDLKHAEHIAHGRLGGEGMSRIGPGEAGAAALTKPEKGQMLLRTGAEGLKDRSNGAEALKDRSNVDDLKNW